MAHAYTNPGISGKPHLSSDASHVQSSPSLGQLLSAGRIGVGGGMYSVETGEVNFFEQEFKLPAPAPTPAHTLHDPRPS